jgi:hypothetical protein
MRTFSGTSRLIAITIALALFGAVLLSTPRARAADTTAATVTCTDGTTSKAGRGACSHHGGIAKAGAASAPAAATNRAPTARGDQDGTGAPPTVSCKDGTQSKGGRGACSHHGGVADAAPNGPSGAPSAAPPQEGAGETQGVMCKDGSRSARSGRGACSHHGGIATAGGATPADTAPAEPAPARASGGKHADATGATAKCKDGTFSHSAHHTGTCSHHGGVAEWLDAPGK